MARRELVQLIDDLDGASLGEDGTSVAFSLDGRDYVIDLSHANAQKLRGALRPYVESARKVKKAGVAARTARPTRSDQAEIRAWARSQGYTVSDRGRVPTKLIADYDRAH